MSEWTLCVWECERVLTWAVCHLFEGLLLAAASTQVEHTFISLRSRERERDHVTNVTLTSIYLSTACIMCAASSLAFGFPHCSHLMYLAVGGREREWVWEWSEEFELEAVEGCYSRFCSGQKFLWGFLDLFFCLFLDSVSDVPSESSSALFWHTVFFSSAWLLPLATGSFGLKGRT